MRDALRYASTALGAVALPAALALATSSGPDPGLTGVPAGGGFAAEATCVSCHASAPLNPDQRGALALHGLPATWEPGQRYPLRFELSHPGADRLRWGFQLSAIAAESYRGAGAFVVTDPSTTRVVSGPGGRAYVSHTYGSTKIGESEGASWSFEWIAPERGTGAVAFYASGNAANMDGSQGGDLIFNPTPAPIARVPEATRPAGAEAAAD